MFYEKVKYKLVIDDDEYLIEEPKGWADEGVTHERHPLYHGISVTYTNSLVFYGLAFQLLKDAFTKHRIGANVSLKRQLVVNGGVRDYYIGDIDFVTYVEKDNSISVKVISSKLDNMLKSILSTKTDVDAEKDFNNNELSELSRRDITIDGFPVVFVGDALLDTTQGYKTARQFRFTSTSSSYEVHAITPLPFTYPKDDNGDSVNDAELSDDIVTIAFADDTVGWGDHSGEFTPSNDEGAIYKGVSRSFYSVAKSTKELKVNTDIKLKVETEKWGDVFALSTMLRMVVVSEDSTLSRTLASSHITAAVDGSRSTTVHEMKTNFNTTIEENESICIELVTLGRGRKQSGSSYGKVESQITEIYKLDVHLVFSSNYESTNHHAYSIKDVLKRILKVNLGIGILSNILDSTEWKGLYLIHGYFIRKIEILNVDKFKGLTTSIKDIYDSLNVVTPVGIELLDKVFRLEALSYFYRDELYKDLGVVRDLEFSVDSSLYPGTIEIGYSKSVNNEKYGGLSEFNTKSIYRTNYINSTTKKMMLSKLRADMLGIEMLRRTLMLGKNQSSGSDKDIWLVDVVYDQGRSKTILANYNKYFYGEPGGDFVADYTFNARLSPRNCMERQKVLFRNFSTLEKEEYLHFTSSDGYEGFSTKLTSSKPRMYENENIKIDNVKDRIHKNIIAKFTTSDELIDVNEIEDGSYNFYKLIKFRYRNEKYQGYIKKVTSNKVGSVVELFLK